MRRFIRPAIGMSKNLNTVLKSVFPQTPISYTHLLNTNYHKHEKDLFFQERTRHQRFFKAIILRVVRELNLSFEIHEEVVIVAGTTPLRPDFHIPKLNLIIQIDGTVHEHFLPMRIDNRQEEALQLLGVYCWRIPNEHLYSRTDWVYRALRKVLTRVQTQRERNRVVTALRRAKKRLPQISKHLAETVARAEIEGPCFSYRETDHGRTRVYRYKAGYRTIVRSRGYKRTRT